MGHTSLLILKLLDKKKVTPTVKNKAVAAPPKNKAVFLKLKLKAKRGG